MDVGDQKGQNRHHILKFSPTHFISNIRHQHRCYPRIWYQHKLSSTSIYQHRYGRLANSDNLCDLDKLNIFSWIVTCAICNDLISLKSLKWRKFTSFFVDDFRVHLTKNHYEILEYNFSFRSS